MKHKSLLPAKVQRNAKSAFPSKDDYEERLEKLQKEMLSLQQYIRRKDKKIIIVFEGPDAAGKGGVIKRLTEYLDPRGYRVHATGAPNSLELQENYMQRFFRSFPEPGSIGIFDRSWYGRVLAERVEKIIPKRDWKRAYSEIVTIEKMLIDDGILILKYILDISYDEQKARFEERREDPLKKWKLTDDDWRNRSKWNHYRKAFKDMIDLTSTDEAPWVIVAADSKWTARVCVLDDVASRAKEFFRS
jgi:polyphosphate kinase 2 (PPK2 family)